MFLLSTIFLFCFHISFSEKEKHFTKFGKGRLIIIYLIFISNIALSTHCIHSAVKALYNICNNVTDAINTKYSFPTATNSYCLQLHLFRLQRQ